MTTTADPPGFLLALVHGVTAPFALIGSFFTDIRIYAFPNSGVFRDLGFLLGLSVGGGVATQSLSREDQGLEELEVDEEFAEEERWE